jgi:uncharacterized membrane protein
MKTVVTRRPRVVRILLARRRLFSSVLVGLVLFALLPPALRLTTRFLLSWDLTAALYVSLTLWMIAHSTAETCRRRAEQYDVGDWLIMLLVVSSAAASFVAILFELAAIRSHRESAAFGLAVTGATVALSWVFTHMIFAMHYANLYYRPGQKGVPGGLAFPGTSSPDYHDFLYQAFVIGCAAQTGDVETVSPAMRRATLIHCVVAFAFNTAILALMINVGASLIS